MKKILSIVPHGLAVFVALIFLDSLRYKFTNHPKTETIFSILNDWSGSVGFPGLFSHTGLFSQYVIGSLELVASVLLVLGITTVLRKWQGWGALIAGCIMTGAIFFHLCTPLGIDPNNDGGGLFVVAVLAWLSSVTLLYLRRKELLELTRSR